ncbi:prepilin-type N-terminal cleavage/methylation domain-containing protein [Methylobacterium sp. Leaf118]|uniref:prepilin-type N-terminal cleavage/methylation domain-containing protein n=1 Tax=Methylobacterium sp. Leaf118 TaxID=2876562 RepID=UPI001E3122CB|nr:prepilin-type N-terminal cleavage/methylation domain-containing protein [Methylobacterium sp. Leaf118]
MPALPPRSRPHRHTGAQAGFTLLELSLALALIGLVAALALPRASPRDSGTSLRIKAYEMIALLRADRDAARARGVPVVARIDLVARALRSGASDRAVALPPRLAVRVSEGLAAGVRFAPDGTASGGEIFLARPGLGGLLAVRIDPLTATVDLDEGGMRGSGGRT